MFSLNLEQIIALAPDAASVKAGRKLASAVKWQNLGANDSALWGECQGSGAKPYQVRVDLSGPAFKCSCPSRKFPCKHALGLMFLLAGDSRELEIQEHKPDWVAEWLENRRKKTQKQENPPARTSADPAARARREEKREKAARAGLEELALWLRDGLHHGIADWPEKPYGFFENMAARLVDAQVPGLATRVRQLRTLALAGDGQWAERVLRALARLHLLVEGYRRIEELPEALREDVRGLVGWHQNREELPRRQPHLRDVWLVAGQYQERDEQLLIQRIWLHGQQTGRYALLLNFAHESRPATLDWNWRNGARHDAELVFYPSAYPLRALVHARHRELAPLESPAPGFADLSGALRAWREGVLSQPWLERFPWWLERVTPRREGGQNWLQDREGTRVPLDSRADGWPLLAGSGGRPLRLFGEWRGESFYPLAWQGEGGYFSAPGLG